ncbi:hypothetical protein [Lacisediminihabitans sp.]|uniref:hypothetical protein n=1 Tax=Lacisediminihabitans sp. TaxID=2787631 RepID=UPI00374DC0D2
MRAFHPTASIAIGAVLLAALLTGCAGPTPTAPAASKTATPTAAPSASSTAGPKDVLFTIAANVRGKDGSTIAILLTAHKPLPYSVSAAKPLKDEFIASCGAGTAGVPVTNDSLAANGSILMPIDIASSSSGKVFVYPVTLSLGNQYRGQSATGKGVAPADSSQPCNSGYTWASSGAVHAVAVFESGNPGPDVKAWRYAKYGFSVPFESNSTIEACTITVTDLGKSVVNGIDGWASPDSDGTSCQIGYVGE